MGVCYFQGYFVGNFCRLTIRLVPKFFLKPQWYLLLARQLKSPQFLRRSTTWQLSSSRSPSKWIGFCWCYVVQFTDWSLHRSLLVLPLVSPLPRRLCPSEIPHCVFYRLYRASACERHKRALYPMSCWILYTRNGVCATYTYSSTHRQVVKNWINLVLSSSTPRRRAWKTSF